MKLIKSLIVAGSVAVTLGALQANAQSFPSLPFSTGSTNQFETLNINLTAKIQSLYNTNSTGNTNISVSTLKTEKITTAAVLNALASAYNTNFPAGSKLALDLLSGDVFVVDKTGQNPIVDVSVGIDNDTNYVNVTFSPQDISDQDWAGYYVVVADKQNQKGPVLNSQTTLATVTCVVDVWTRDQYVYLVVSGNDTSVFKATAKAATESDAVTVSGFGYIGNSDASVEGQVTGAGSWKAAAAQ
jgi:hypothetical protein